MHTFLHPSAWTCDVNAIEPTDDRVSLPPANGKDPYIASAQTDAIPELYDIPIGMVNSVLYHEVIGRARAKARTRARREAAEGDPHDLPGRGA